MNNESPSLAGANAKPGYYSDKTCACGCGTILLAEAVAKGKMYVWGHKKSSVGAKSIASVVSQRAPATRRVEGGASSMASTIAFMREKRKTVIDEMRRIGDEKALLARTEERLTKEAARLALGIEALEDLDKTA